MSNAWKVQPLKSTIMEILKAKGQLSDTSLFEALRAFYKDIGFADVNMTLMRMEISGLVRVSSLSKDKRLVQLVKEQ